MRTKGCVGIVILALSASPALAQQGKLAAADYPNKVVRWVVPFTPGAANDIVARLMAGKLAQTWGHQFVIDNRPGVGGALGAETVARATPDGYTLMLANAGPNVNNPLMLKKPTYRIEDFAPVIYIGYTPLIIAAHPSFPPRHPRELVDYAKAHPGKINFASPGTGSSAAVATALFQAATGVELVVVTYRGSAPANTDVMGGMVQAVSRRQ